MKGTIVAEVAAAIGPWVAILALGLSIINMVSAWISRPGKELKEEADRHVEVTGERFKDHDRRIQKLEDSQPHQPTKEDLHQLSVRMAELTTRMEGLSHTVDRVDRHLREQK